MPPLRALGKLTCLGVHLCLRAPFCWTKLQQSSDESGTGGRRVVTGGTEGQARGGSGRCRRVALEKRKEPQLHLLATSILSHPATTPQTRASSGAHCSIRALGAACSDRSHHQLLSPSWPRGSHSSPDQSSGKLYAQARFQASWQPAPKLAAPDMIAGPHQSS